MIGMHLVLGGDGVTFVARGKRAMLPVARMRIRHGCPCTGMGEKSTLS